MKSLKQFVFVLLFVSALVVNANAGDLDTPGLVQPPPPTTASTSEGTPEGLEVIAGDVSITSDQIFYDALMAMLSLF